MNVILGPILFLPFLSLHIQDIDMNVNGMVPGKSSKSDKRLSVERIYQKKTQLEHIILRPDSYIGSTEPCQQNMWIWDDESSSIISKNITFSPGLYKIFDEIIGKSCLLFTDFFKLLFLKKQD